MISVGNKLPQIERKHVMYDEILEKYKDIKNVGYALSLLNWDQSTYITENGVEARADSMATLSKIAHAMITSDELYGMISDLCSNGLSDLDDAKRNEILKIREDVEYERKIPSELVTEMTRVTSLAMSAWEIARSDNDDAEFLPKLMRIYELKKQYAAHLGYETNPYDALLDRYDKGLKYSYIKPLFEKLGNETRVLLEKIEGSGVRIDESFLSQKYDVERQWDFGNYILRIMGIDFDSFRQDKSAHPFTTEIGLWDVRITTNISEDSLFKGFYSTVHEGGHSLYTLGARKHFGNSSCGEITSLSLHESQSRFYENIIARSRMFWETYLPEAKKLFPGQLKDVSAEEFYRSANVVKKNQIRIDADEVTYNLHIILRTEIENELLNDERNAADINEIWNEKFKFLFGFYPESKSKGYLQDIHWSDGLVGYFPTYAIGNLISAQFYYKMQEETGNFTKLTATELDAIQDWFDRNLYAKGRIYDSFDTVKLICGEELKSEYFMKYLNDKFSDIYRIG
jgi:carboxypeptidase Taq